MTCLVVAWSASASRAQRASKARTSTQTRLVSSDIRLSRCRMRVLSPSSLRKRCSAAVKDWCAVSPSSSDQAASANSNLPRPRLHVLSGRLDSVFADVIAHVVDFNSRFERALAQFRHPRLGPDRRKTVTEVARPALLEYLSQKILKLLCLLPLHGHPRFADQGTP